MKGPKSAINFLKLTKYPKNEGVHNLKPISIEGVIARNLSYDGLPL